MVTPNKAVLKNVIVQQNVETGTLELTDKNSKILKTNMILMLFDDVPEGDSIDGINDYLAISNYHYYAEAGFTIFEKSQVINNEEN